MEETFWPEPDEATRPARIEKLAKQAVSLHTAEQLASMYAEALIRCDEAWYYLEQQANAWRELEQKFNDLCPNLERIANRASDHLETLELARVLLKLLPAMRSAGLRQAKMEASRRGSAAASARHAKPGGARSKAEAIRALWASGKYSSRSVCAEQECGALEMSFDSARKALRNTPEPMRGIG